VIPEGGDAVRNGALAKKNRRAGHPVFWGHGRLVLRKATEWKGQLDGLGKEDAA